MPHRKQVSMETLRRLQMLEHTPPAYLTKEERADQVAAILATACARVKEKAQEKRKSLPAYVLDINRKKNTNKIPKR